MCAGNHVPTLILMHDHNSLTRCMPPVYHKAVCWGVRWTTTSLWYSNIYILHIVNRPHWPSTVHHFIQHPSHPPQYLCFLLYLCFILYSCFILYPRVSSCTCVSSSTHVSSCTCALSWTDVPMLHLVSMYPCFIIQPWPSSHKLKCYITIGSSITNNTSPHPAT